MHFKLRFVQERLIKTHFWRFNTIEKVNPQWADEMNETACFIAGAFWFVLAVEVYNQYFI